MKIEPALTAEEWARWRDEVRLSRSISPRQAVEEVLILAGGKYSEEVIAKANDVLPDSDPRKITRATVQALRHAALQLRGRSVQSQSQSEATPYDTAADALALIAAALESYLPPRDG